MARSPLVTCRPERTPSPLPTTRRMFHTFDEESLGSLLPSAISLTLSEDESKRQDYRLASETPVTGG